VGFVCEPVSLLPYHDRFIFDERTTTDGPAHADHDAAARCHPLLLNSPLA
jgi:hypothetical protein